MQLLSITQPLSITRQRRKKVMAAARKSKPAQLI